MLYRISWYKGFLLYVKFNLFSKSCLFASLLRLWNIGETCINIWKRSLFHILNGCTQICWPTASCHGPWNSRVVSLVWPSLASQSSTRWLTMDFQCFCRLSLNYTYLTCRNFVCQHSVMVETTLKPCAFAYMVSYFPTCIGKPGAIFSAHVNIRPVFRQTVFALRRSCPWVLRVSLQKCANVGFVYRIPVWLFFIPPTKVCPSIRLHMALYPK